MSGKKTMLARARSAVRDFAISRRGNVAIMFGLALVPMMIAVGVGLDFARAAMVRSQMTEALDAASLAVGSTPNLDKTKAQALAEKYFKANYTGKNKTDVEVADFDPAKGRVTITAKTSVDMTLLKLLSNPFEVGASSTVVWGQTKLWVALVLDNSGSMCQPVGSPCNDTTDVRTKIYQLKTATTDMLANLQGVSTTPGDVEVAIIPFNRAVDVGTGNVGESWIDWTDWEAPPANVASINGNVGPGSACPFSTGANGWNCRQNSTNGSSKADYIPSSGLICPGIDSGSVNTDRRARYYNGCWDSVPTQTKTVTKTEITPDFIRRRGCNQTGTGTITCNRTTGLASYPPETPVVSTTTTTTAGYTGDSNVVENTTDTTEKFTDGSKSCDNSSPKKCSWTRFYYITQMKVTTTKTGVGPWNHTWRVNARSTWGGCIMDRWKDDTDPEAEADGYDVKNTAPTTAETRFPAANLNNQVSATNCMAGNITKLGHVWTDLTAAVTAMQANGSTNQAIGVAHGWQMLTPGEPYDTAAVPTNTTRYIILLSDGLNTQNRWWGDGQTEGTIEDGYIDKRMNMACTNAKADGIVIYTLYVHVNGGGNSQPLKDCASDTSKYYDLTSSDQIAVAFADITKQITNVRIEE